MTRRPPTTTRTDTLDPYTSLFRYHSHKWRTQEAKHPILHRQPRNVGEVGFVVVDDRYAKTRCMGREQAIETGALERQAVIFARRRLVERKERDGFDEGFEGFGQRRLAQLRSQCDLRQADDRNADFTGRAFGDAAEIGRAHV